MRHTLNNEKYIKNVNKIHHSNQTELRVRKYRAAINFQIVSFQTAKLMFPSRFTRVKVRFLLVCTAEITVVWSYIENKLRRENAVAHLLENGNLVENEKRNTEPKMLQHLERGTMHNKNRDILSLDPPKYM